MSISEKDILYLASLDCIKTAMKRICDVKGAILVILLYRICTHVAETEITPEIVVYRFSSQKLVEHLRTKVSRLSNRDVFEGSRTLIRGLARDGLMEDGKEELLECVSEYSP